MKVHYIIGPTGIGKTKHAHALASQRDLPVVTFDRCQVFPDLAVGTARPSQAEVGDVERHFLGGDRLVEQGELTSTQAWNKYIVLIDDLQCVGHREVIVEGGSISLCQRLMETDPEHDIDLTFLPITNMDDYNERVHHRIRGMLFPAAGRSIWDEVQQFWGSPRDLATLKTIIGYDLIIKFCEDTGLEPRDAAGEFGLASRLIDDLHDAHLEYAGKQLEVFGDVVRWFNYVKYT